MLTTHCMLCESIPACVCASKSAFPAKLLLMLFVVCVCYIQSCTMLSGAGGLMIEVRRDGYER